MFHVITLNGQSRPVRLATDPEGVPHVTDDYGCSWAVAEFDVTAPVVEEVAVIAATDIVEEVGSEPTSAPKRQRRAKPASTEEPVAPVVAETPVDPTPVEPPAEPPVDPE